LSRVTQNSKKKEWAYDKCSVITEGPMFAGCRQKIAGYKVFYDDCVQDACTWVIRHFLHPSFK